MRTIENPAAKFFGSIFFGEQCNYWVVSFSKMDFDLSFDLFGCSKVNALEF